MVRVLEGGLIGAGDAMTLERREQHGVTVAEVTRVLLIDKDDIDGALRIAAVGSLTEPMRKQLATRFSQVDDVDIEDDAERLNIP
jgi:MOSC domain-containing protein YiiM